MNNEDFLENTTKIFKALGSNNFGQALLDTIHTQVPFDGSVIILFHPQHYPIILQEKLSKLDKKVFWKIYMEGFYLFDPFYKLCSQGKKGMFHLPDIFPQEFFSSKYFKQYFRPAELKDEINYIFQTSSEISGLLCISRSTSMKKFNREEKNKLQDLAKFIDTVITRHLEIGNINFVNKQFNSQPYLEEPTTLFMPNNKILTRRENEISLLMLRGLSSKATANILNISPATENTHRKNIYKKMKVNSHAELLANVLEKYSKTHTHVANNEIRKVS